MRCLAIFVTVVCLLFLLKLKWLFSLSFSLYLSLGTLTIKITISGVTSKKDSPEYNALRERFTAFATQELEFSSPSTQQELQKFCYYLRESLNLELSKENADSFILTVHCRTLEILERLWEDYCSGHLDQIAEDCFLTDEKTKTEEERGKTDTISLETDISEEDYLRCKQFLTGKLRSQVAIACLGHEISGPIIEGSQMSIR